MAHVNGSCQVINEFLVRFRAECDTRRIAIRIRGVLRQQQESDILDAIVITFTGTIALHLGRHNAIRSRRRQPMHGTLNARLGRVGDCSFKCPTIHSDPIESRRLPTTSLRALC